MAKSPETELPLKAFGWAARDTSATLSPFHFYSRENGDDDVTLKILFCGGCHSDLHTIKNDWGFTTYPVVPGVGGFLVDAYLGRYLDIAIFGAIQAAVKQPSIPIAL